MATGVLGASGRAMLEALISGPTDPKVLAQLGRGRRLRSEPPAPRDAPEVPSCSHSAPMVGKILARIDYLDEEPISGSL